MKDLPKRVLTAVVFGVVVIGSIIAGPYTFGILLSAICAIGLSEYYRIANGSDTNRIPWMAVLSGLLISTVSLLVLNGLIETGHLHWLVILPFISMIISLFNNDEQLPDSAKTIFGWFYVVAPIILWAIPSFCLNGHEEGYISTFPLGYLVLLWASDTGAYFAGVNFGKHKLFERISPKKTWEGFAGGLILSGIAGYLVGLYSGLLTPATWVILAIIIVVTGTLGDLFESSLKRKAGVKDSGTILPGHGGVLDRFDGLLLSAPFVFIYLWLTGNLSL